MAEADDQFILNEEALDDLYAWIDTIPLSRPKKNIARDFSDGVLCAEAVAFFKPKLVDIHNYFAASSAMQKKTNWNTLNRKVFQKIGLRLTDATIQQLVEAVPGAIEQVLWDVRQKVQDQQPSSRNQDHRSSDHRSEQRPASHAKQQQQHRPKGHNAPNTIPRPGTGYGHQQQYHEEPEYFDPPAPAAASNSRGTMSYQSQGTGIPMPPSTTKDRPVTPSYKGQAQSQPQSEYQSYQSQGQGQGQGYIVQPHQARRSSSVISESGNNNPSAAPTQIVYRGHKMVSLGQLEDKEREIKGLEQANKNLTTKILRIETLVNVKDQRIEDLTHQLHNLRNLYERTTQQTTHGY